MKPLHIGLLIVGAALAGGLAMKMTDLPPIPRPGPVVDTTPPAAMKPPVIPELAEPAPRKPSPMPRSIVPAAPPPVYVEPPHVQPAHTQLVHIAPAPVEPPHIEQAAPKTKPVVIAKAAALPHMLPPVPYDAPSQPAPEPPPPALRRTATLPEGMTIAVRLNESLSSQRGIAGDTFDASLSEPLVVDGLVIAERGARARGLILGTQRAGRVTGTSSLDLEITMVETADGQKIEISTAPWTKRGDASYGPSSAALSRGRPVNLPSDTVIRFRLASRVTITERQL